MKDWRDRIELAMKIRGVTQGEIAAACKIKPGSVSAWWGINKRTKMIMGDNLVAVARLLGTTGEWIVTGKPDATVPAAASQPARLDVETMSEAISLLGMVSDARGWKRPENVNPIALSIVYELLMEDASTSNVIDFMKRFNARLAEREKADGGRRKKVAGDSA